MDRRLNLGHKILVCGLPGAGKTTFAMALAPKLNAVLFNADQVRTNLNKDLGFSVAHRVEQARRMGWLCNQVNEAGHTAIADFVCPTHETRQAFGATFVVWADRIKEGRFRDTNKLFQKPAEFHVRIDSRENPEYWVEMALLMLR